MKKIHEISELIDMNSQEYLYGCFATTSDYMLKILKTYCRSNGLRIIFMANDKNEVYVKANKEDANKFFEFAKSIGCREAKIPIDGLENQFIFGNDRMIIEYKLSNKAINNMKSKGIEVTEIQQVETDLISALLSYCIHYNNNKPVYKLGYNSFGTNKAYEVEFDTIYNNADALFEDYINRKNKNTA